MDIGPLTCAIYIDLKEAFDTIDHNLLLSKLQYTGTELRVSHLNGLTVIWRIATKESKSIYGVLSSPTIIQTGVPQGSIMGSLLFFLYINDLPVCINFSKVMLYADDTIIYNAAKTGAELEMILSLDLNNVAMWMKQNELFLNTKKMEYVICGTR